MKSGAKAIQTYKNFFAEVSKVYDKWIWHSCEANGLGVIISRHAATKNHITIICFTLGRM